MTDTIKKTLKIGYTMLIVIGLSIIVGLIFAFPVMWLWNWIVPYATGGIMKPIDVWHAWGLTVLCSILFSKGSSVAKD